MELCCDAGIYVYICMENLKNSFLGQATALMMDYLHLCAYVPVHMTWMEQQESKYSVDDDNNAYQYATIVSALAALIRFDFLCVICF
jgi:hypothetical protein